MSYNNYETDDKIYNLVKAMLTNRGILDVPLYWSNQDISQPHGNYITLNLTSLTLLGSTELRYIGEVSKAKTIRELRVSMNFYGPDAYGISNAIFDALGLSSIWDAFTEQGLALVDHGAPRDLTFVRNARRTRRYQFDFRVRLKKIIDDADVDYTSSVDEIDVTIN